MAQVFNIQTLPGTGGFNSPIKYNVYAETLDEAIRIAIAKMAQFGMAVTDREIDRAASLPYTAQQASKFIGTQILNAPNPDEIYTPELHSRYPTTTSPVSPVGVPEPAQYPEQFIGELPRDPAVDDRLIREGAFFNALSDVGASPEGAFGYAARSLQTPAQLLFDLAARLGTTGNLEDIGDAPGAVRGRYADILRGLSGFGSGTIGNQVQNAFDAIRAGTGDVASQFRSVDPLVDPYSFTTVRDLGRQAAISKFGGAGANLLPTDKLFEERYNRERESAGFRNQNIDFLDFAARQFGI